MMVPSSHKTLLVACFATACLLPWIQSLSIPPTPKVQEFQGTIPSDGDATTTAIPSEDANNGLGDDLVVRRLQKDDIPAEEQSRMRADSDQERDTMTVSSSKLSQKASPANTVDTDEPVTTTITDDIGTEDPTGTDSPLVQKLQPVFEVVDIVLRPFRPPAVMVLEFFRKPSNATGSSSEDDDTKPTLSSSSENRSESEENEGSAPASPSGTGVGTSSNENSGEKKGAHKAAAGLEIITTTPPSSQSALKDTPNGDSTSSEEQTTQSRETTVPTGSNKGDRKRRETNQRGNNSNTGDDETSGKGKFQQDADDSMTSSTTAKNTNVENDDTPINADISGDDDDNDDKDTGNNGGNKTDGNKSGTVKIFLEILQLVPLSNSSVSSPSTLSSMGGESSPSITSTTTTTPRGESAEADPNQKFPSANPSVQTRESFEGKERVARSVTKSAAAAEEKSNPSSSPTASALPSS